MHSPLAYHTVRGAQNNFFFLIFFYFLLTAVMLHSRTRVVRVFFLLKAPLHFPAVLPKARVAFCVAFVLQLEVSCITCELLPRVVLFCFVAILRPHSRSAHTRKPFTWYFLVFVEQAPVMFALSFFIFVS